MRDVQGLVYIGDSCFVRHDKILAARATPSPLMGEHHTLVVLEGNIKILLATDIDTFIKYYTDGEILVPTKTVKKLVQDEESNE